MGVIVKEKCDFIKTKGTNYALCCLGRNIKKKCWPEKCITFVYMGDVCEAF